MAHDCLVLPEPQDELALILGKKLDKIISMQHDRGVPESAVGGWCVAPAFSGAAVPVAQGCVDTARRGGDLQRDQDPCVQSSNENPLFQESCVGPATLAAALAALDVGSQKRQQKRQPWLAQLQLLNLRKVSVRRSFITDVASDGDCDEAEEVARTASTSSTSHTSCDSDVSTGCRDALDEDDAHLAVEPPALSAPDIGACFDTFLSRCDQATLIIEQPAEYEDLEAMQRAQLNSAIAAEFLAARQEALCKRVLVAWREHTQQAALVAALLREVALLREEKVLRATFRALLDHAIAASVGRTAAQLRLNGASTSDSACIEGGGSGGSGSDGGHGSSSLGAVENRGGSPSCSSWRQSPASSASSGRAEASPFKELYGVLWNMKHEARSSGGGSRSSTEEPRQGASPAAILEGQQWRSSLAASSSVTSTAAPAAAVLPPPPTAAQRSTTWPAKPQAIGDWLQPDSPSAVTPPRPPHGSSSNSMVFPTAAYDEERASAGGVGTPTVSVSRVKTAVATLAAVVSALCGSPAAVSSPTYDTVYDGVLAQSEQRASSRSAPSAAEVAVRQQATHSPAATSSSGPSSVAQPSGAATSAASARRRHQESVQARVAELAAQADEEHRLADGAGDEAIRRRHHAAAVKLAADIARLTKGLRQYGR